MATPRFDGSPLTLKYRFRAFFMDGKIIEQRDPDVSEKFAGRTAFTEVMHEINNGNPLVLFRLGRCDSGPETETDPECMCDSYFVDLTDGTFQIGGRKLKMHDEDLENFRPIYFIVRDTHFNCKPENVQFDSDTFSGEDVHYRVGFQANEKRTHKNVERWIEIS